MPSIWELNRLSYELTSVLKRRGGSDASRKIGNVSAIAHGGRFEADGVLAHFSPAGVSIDLSDFGSKSAEG